MTDDSVEVDGLADRVERILNTPIYRPDEHDHPGLGLENADNGNGESIVFDPDRPDDRWITIDNDHLLHIRRDAR